MSPIVDLAFGGESVTTNKDSDWLTESPGCRIRNLYLGGGEADDPLASPAIKTCEGSQVLYPDRTRTHV